MRLGVRRAVEIAAQIADALAEGHAEWCTGTCGRIR